MSLVALDELVSEVRVSMDENAEQMPYMHGQYGENLELDEIIRAKVVEAARVITEEAPVESLEPTLMVTTVTPSKGGGVLSVPEDFLRLVSIKMKGWSRSVTVVASEGSDIELMQRNPHTRGTSVKPVCTFGHNEEGKKVIEYFGSAEEIEKALYIQIPSVIIDDGIEYLNISRLLRQSIVRRAVGLVYQSRGEIQLAASYIG